MIETLLIGTLLGATGQGARTILGLKKAKENNQKFNLKRLLISLIIGAIAGTLAAIFMINKILNQTDLLFLAAAGYTGTDAIEAFIKKHFEVKT